MEILSFEDSALPADLRHQVEALEAQAWPPIPGVPAHGHDPKLAPQAMVVVAGGRVVSSLAILSKEIVHGGIRFAASGLSAVVTDRAERGRGFGHSLVVAGREAIRASGADLGIFTCDEPLLSFYEEAGWQLLAGTALIGGTPQVPLPSDLFAKVAVAAFFTEHARRHAASFHGARVELYPGEIDRLW
ncbi:MAG: GNAT family N-acetyltransferase [Candidatus Dormibacterales bacterium]